MIATLTIAWGAIVVLVLIARGDYRPKRSLDQSR